MLFLDGGAGETDRSLSGFLGELSSSPALVEAIIGCRGLMGGAPGSAIVAVRCALEPSPRNGDLESARLCELSDAVAGAPAPRDPARLPYPRLARSAIERARYEVPEAEVTFHAGRVNPELDALLARHGAKDWAYVSTEESFGRDLQLAAPDAGGSGIDVLARERGWKSLGAWRKHGRDAAAFGRLLLGIDPDAALALGRRLEQLSVLIGRRREPARLVWLEEVP